VSVLKQCRHLANNNEEKNVSIFVSVLKECRHLANNSEENSVSVVLSIERLIAWCRPSAVPRVTLTSVCPY